MWGWLRDRPNRLATLGLPRSAVALIPCPSCGGTTTRALENVTPDDRVQYHRCDACGHVWVTFTDGRSTQHVTPLRPSAGVVNRKAG